MTNDKTDKDRENLIEEFWTRVVECEPTDIHADTIRVVSDEDIHWLIDKIESKKQEWQREVKSKCTSAFWEFYNRCMDEVESGCVSEEIMNEVMDKYEITPPSKEVDHE